MTSLARHTLEALAETALPAWHSAEAAVRVHSLAPGKQLFASGERHPYVYFVRSGLLKLVYDTEDGKEWIKAFPTEGEFFASAEALRRDGLTAFAARALEPTVLERLDFRCAQQLAEQHLAWQKAIARAFQLYGERKEKRERELLTLTPSQRYWRLLEERPTLVARLPQKELARYLGMTPVGLSRIKHRQLPEPQA